MTFKDLSSQVDDTIGANSSLLANNSFFSALRRDKTLYFTHVTQNKDSILKEGVVHPSSGCLIGSVYLCPAYLENDGRLRLHNLGAWYYTQEGPQSMALKGRNDPLDLIIFKLELGEEQRAGFCGVNYLKFGDLHYDIYKELSYLLLKEEQDQLLSVVSNRIHNSFDFLQSIPNYRQKISDSYRIRFFKEFRNQIVNLPILGYVYFEALTRTIMLHQNDEISKNYKEKGEFYNWHYKQLMAALYPKFFCNFNLGTFNPRMEDILDWLYQKKLIPSEDDFLEDFNTQLFRTLDYCLQLDESSLCRGAQDIDAYPSLTGHLIHRELRNFSRYPDFYFYFDHSKALKMWNYWNANSTLVPFMSIIPKGECGLNPALLSNVKLSIHGSRNLTEKDGFYTVEIDKPTTLKVAVRLVDTNRIFMRGGSPG